jgi:glycosyltransferase involved in cell wall biosynthesis
MRPSTHRPMISCLMVTRERPAMARRAIECYAAQDYDPRELVIVCDGHEEYEELREHARGVCRTDVAISAVARGSLPLGALRNRSLRNASGDVVCQWDDDDLSHPNRLSAQCDHMLSEGASACVLTDHLHLMRQDRSLYWCDWARPRGLLQPTAPPATLMYERRAANSEYPESGPMSRRSEDAMFLRSLMKRCTVATLNGRGWLFLYVLHGSNTWDESHHMRIVRATGKSADDLLQQRRVLNEAAAVYGLGSDVMVRDHLGAPVFALQPLDAERTPGMSVDISTASKARQC